jgi:hypothetical protein
VFLIFQVALFQGRLRSSWGGQLAAHRTISYAIAVAAALLPAMRPNVAPAIMPEPEA